MSLKNRPAVLLLSATSLLEDIGSIAGYREKFISPEVSLIEGVKTGTGIATIGGGGGELDSADTWWDDFFSCCLNSVVPSAMNR